MKKLLLLFLLLITSLSYGSYHDVQWMKTDIDTTNYKTNWFYRGNAFFVSGSTQTHPMIADCTSYVKIYSTGTVIAVEFIGDISKCTGGGSSGASSLQIKVGGVEVSSPTASLDFTNFFTGTESPAGEANIILSTTALSAYFSVSTHTHTATYLAIDGSNANQVINIGSYGIITSSDINAHDFIASNSLRASVNAIVGLNQLITSAYSSILGGTDNLCADDYGVIAGGTYNTIGDSGGSNNHNTISGGYNNTISGNPNGFGSTISGGYTNYISSHGCTIGGGEMNEAHNDYNTVSGGYGNECWSDAGTIAGGFLNFISTSASDSSIGGGSSNTSHGERGTISGGISNTIIGNYNSIGGGWDNTAGLTSTYGAIAGGKENSINGGDAAGILTGYQNSVYGASSIMGGWNNTVNADWSSIISGRESIVTGDYSTAFGYYTVVNGTGAIAGGYGEGSGAGEQCRADGQGSVALGNLAQVIGTASEGSVALGHGIVNNAANAFSFGNVTNTIDNSFKVGVPFYASSGVYASNGFGADGQYLKTDGAGGLTWETVIGGGGGASTLQIKVDDVEITSPTVSINFTDFFIGSESPSGEANISISTDSLDTYFLGLHSKADDSELLDGIDSTYFLNKIASGDTTYLKLSGGTLTGSLGLVGTNNYITGEAITSKWYSNNTKVFETTDASMTVNVPLYIPQGWDIQGSSVSWDAGGSRLFFDDSIYVAGSIYTSNGNEIACGGFIQFRGDTNYYAGYLGIDKSNSDTMQLVLGSQSKNTFVLTNDYYKKFTWTDQTHPTLVLFSDTDPSTTGRGNHALLQNNGEDFRIATGTSTPNIVFDVLNDGDENVEITDSSMTVNVALHAKGTLDVASTLTSNGTLNSAGQIKMYDDVELKLGTSSDFSIGFDSSEENIVICSGADIESNEIMLIDNSSVTVNVPLYLGSNDLNIAEGKLADSTIISADIKDGTIVAGDMSASTTGYFTNWDNLANVPAGFADGIDNTGGGGESILQIQIDGVEVSSPTLSIDFTDFFTGNESPAGEANISISTNSLNAYFWGKDDGALISTAPVTNGDDTHIPTCDHVYEFCETTQDYLKTSEYTPGGGGSSALEVMVEGVRISSPTASINFNNPFFVGTLVGGVTAQIDISTSALDSYYISEEEAVLVSSAAVTNDDTTHIPSCDAVYDFCETTQDYLKTSEYSASGDNLGNHIATTTLNMDGNNIDDAGTITADAVTSTCTYASNAGMLGGLTQVEFLRTTVQYALASGLVSEIAERKNEIGSLTTTYLGISAKAADADTLDSHDTAYFQQAVTEGSLPDSVIVSADIKNGEVSVADLASAIIPGGDYAICISTPYALGVIATIISPFRDYAVTISTISAQTIGGNNVVFMVEQRTIADIESAGTDIWSGDVTAVINGWTGGTSSDFTVPAGSALFLVITSVSGDVDRFIIKYRLTKD